MIRPEHRDDLRGDLQSEIMTAVWKLQEGSVEDVRALLTKDRRSAYTTIQTVMNRLVDSGHLERERKGRAFFYRPTRDEAEHVARAIDRRLAGASPEARRAALIELIGGLGEDDLEEIARCADRIRRARKRE